MTLTPEQERRKPMFAQKPCDGCGASIDHRVKSGRCKPCSRKPCLDCGKPTGVKNESGRCSSCFSRLANADPAFQAKRIAGIKRKFAEPYYMARTRERARQLGLKYAQDPELRARRVAYGKWVHANVLSRPEIVAKCRAAVKLCGPKQSASKLAWCPPEYREMHRENMRRKRMLAADSKALILALIAEQKARPKTFEEKLQMVLDGKATVYTVPIAKPASNDFTLGGVSSGWAA